MTLKRASMSALVVATLCVAATSAEAQGPYYAVPSWDQTLPASTRFIVLANMSGAAVLDRETGLVWERTPDSFTFTWGDAQNSCTVKKLGNRMGWRLPSLQELASLVDPSETSPSLPSGHPFGNVASSLYWSATTRTTTSFAFVVGFDSGTPGILAVKGVDHLHVWCVRGGLGVYDQ